MKETLLKKVKDRSIVCGTVGLGYVGLPLAVEKAKAGFKTIGFDVQVEKVDMVNRGENYIGDVVNEDLAALVTSGMIAATSDFSRIADCDFVAICVPTPLDKHQQPDTSYMEASAKEIAPHLKRGVMVVLESTTYPGTTEELIKPILEQGSGLVCGESLYLGFSPERVDPGNLVYKTKNTPKVVGAIGEDALECIAAVYEAVLEGGVTCVSSPAVAEMEKILENTYRNVNIGLVNELAMLCDRMDINVWEVIDAAKTKPYGFTAFYPGPGLGGHCIPLDPYYLSWKAREYGFHTSMIEASMMVNDRMPEYCVDRAARVLNGRGKALNGSKVLVLGVAYKQDIDDYRESPALPVIEHLSARGADVSYYDPWVAEYRHKGQSHSSIPQLTAEAVEGADLVMVACAHTNVDYDFVQSHAQAVFDTKNAMKSVKHRDNIEVL
ncbi:nucleotide sugar dehydrogenase [Gordonibacter urolithinfaciens]|uniref:Nucleotide sugar dehydrogenase n=1 Tax=Gordonibacter urolithinfaciens TaxID=1335613 RepID=A0A6N8IJF1_9ACTN|nr:nucleotide sugar dehydrogenase [Gordonibacter urolithinfaciens]MVM55615.1 nucleotide sugar dehydrogenase [Gordonibacter urolithinfaciens]MVN15968.1 nucleotide sugar dehydrogenase [Gordonibacter urolithinfaciens]MVN39510.1 nucleotide sugar dehydrogenase [Gordonibacter urolithinfaciens]MVN56470.1 nucleotide sugar dehydrogenase [Gordonibacter urolithinfaciens]MVN61706.1 nucleotide sugar dehydrogenase [Gordonibacter urolithinfaciens]